MQDCSSAVRGGACNDATYQRTFFIYIEDSSSIRSYIEERPYCYSQQHKVYDCALLILGQLTRKTPSLSAEITSEQVQQGFRRWSKATTTSPSNRTSALETIRRLSLFDAQITPLRLAVRQGISLQRWQVSVTVMLEKITGKRFQHKLRVIHLLEADYNTLRYIWGHIRVYPLLSGKTRTRT